MGNLSHVLVRLEPWVRSLGALREQCDGFVERQRWHRILVFSLNIETFAARREHLCLEPPNERGDAR